jgi:hypothetical protein
MKALKLLREIEREKDKNTLPMNALGLMVLEDIFDLF